MLEAAWCTTLRATGGTLCSLLTLLSAQEAETVSWLSVALVGHTRLFHVTPLRVGVEFVVHAPDPKEVPWTSIGIAKLGDVPEDKKQREEEEV